MRTGHDRERELDRVYAQFNDRAEAHRDPVRFLHAYSSSPCIEFAGLVASSLAYGRVAQIIKSVSHVLSLTGGDARLHSSFRDASRLLAGFKHRFTTGEEIASLVSAVRRMIAKRGSLCDGFLAHYDPSHENVLPALHGFVAELKRLAPAPMPSLLPSPDKGSAMKRLNLFLRWMVRKDEIDPGPWERVPRSKLIIPLDVHMHRIGISLGFTKRRQADMKTAIEITEGFRALSPQDPVKYDFCLTHSSISGTFGNYT